MGAGPRGDRAELTGHGWGLGPTRAWLGVTGRGLGELEVGFVSGRGLGLWVLTSLLALQAPPPSRTPDPTPLTPYPDPAPWTRRLTAPAPPTPAPGGHSPASDDSTHPRPSSPRLRRLHPWPSSPGLRRLHPSMAIIPLPQLCLSLWALEINAFFSPNPGSVCPSWPAVGGARVTDGDRVGGPDDVITPSALSLAATPLPQLLAPATSAVTS